MRLERIVFIGLCLVLSIGLIFVHMAICQQTKPGEYDRSGWRNTKACGFARRQGIDSIGKGARATQTGK